LVERVSDGRLPACDVRIPPWRLPAEQGVSQPEVTRPEEERQISDVEDARGREQAEHRNEGERNDSQLPTPNSQEASPQNSGIGNWELGIGSGHGRRR